MTDSTEPREGWYVVYRPDGSWTVRHKTTGGTNVPPGWTLGPRIDDLLRDATQLRKAAQAWVRLARGDFILGDSDLVTAWNELAVIFDAEIAREGGR